MNQHHHVEKKLTKTQAISRYFDLNKTPRETLHLLINYDPRITYEENCKSLNVRKKVLYNLINHYHLAKAQKSQCARTSKIDWHLIDLLQKKHHKIIQIARMLNINYGTLRTMLSWRKRKRIHHQQKHT